MGTKEINISIKEIETEIGNIKDLRFSVGRLAQETWDEP
ncbi:MAG: hypothetical protein XD88_0342, partial [Methanocalculus sp. 52_23]